jgi:hypothetical protein
MTDMIVKDDKLAFINDAGEVIYFLPQTAATDENKVVEFTDPPIRLGSNQITKDLTLADGQSTLFITDNLTIPTGTTVTLSGDATLNVVPPYTFGRLRNNYHHGEVVQTIVHRTDEFRYITTESGTVTAFNATAFVHAIATLSIRIKPKFANSIILIEGQIFGEGAHNLGYVMLRDWNGYTDQYGHGAFITDKGFEGYSAKGLNAAGTTYASNARLGQIGSFNDANNTDSTPQNTHIMWFGKPNTTNEVVYTPALISAAEQSFMLNHSFDNEGSTATNREFGVSFITATELFQED